MTTNHKRTSSGFTLIELLVFIILIGSIGLFAIINIRGYQAKQRDSQRKTDMNTISYYLEQYSRQYGYYPKTISEKNIKVQTDSLNDPKGKTINQNNSDYYYIPLKCKNDKCKSYTLQANLETEPQYILKSQ